MVTARAICQISIPLLSKHDDKRVRYRGVLGGGGDNNAKWKEVLYRNKILSSLHNVFFHCLPSVAFP
jgi:hypothetical protein